LALARYNTAALPAALQDYHPNAAIGNVCQEWDGDIGNLNTRLILKLIIFYNDDFGIIMADSVPRRIDKILRWLKRLE
jgi:hypothetical protein